jgi:hypothetical protein
MAPSVFGKLVWVTQMAIALCHAVLCVTTSAVSCCAVLRRPGLSKVQLAEISVQCKELYTKALKQQQATGYGLQLPPLMPQNTGEGGGKGWKFWRA